MEKIKFNILLIVLSGIMLMTMIAVISYFKLKQKSRRNWPTSTLNDKADGKIPDYFRQRARRRWPPASTQRQNEYSIFT